jgi:ketosteroid isomerase-like protein
MKRHLLLLMLGLVIACSPAMAQDDASIREFVERYDRTIVSGDADAVRALLADDYRQIAEGRTHDRDQALADFAKDDYAGRGTTMSSTVDRVEMSGELAVVSGVVNWKQGDESGSEHYTLVLERDGGGWKALMEHVSETADPDDK